MCRLELICREIQPALQIRALKEKTRKEGMKLWKLMPLGLPVN
jgi:hypothetical protein